MHRTTLGRKSSNLIEQKAILFLTIESKPPPIHTDEKAEPNLPRFGSQPAAVQLHVPGVRGHRCDRVPVAGSGF